MIQLRFIAAVLVVLTCGFNMPLWADEGESEKPKESSDTKSGETKSPEAKSPDSPEAKSPEGNKIEAMFPEGKFKSKDGYDPDTDPALHPKNQDYRARQQINAEYQAKHNAEYEKNGAPENSGPSTKESESKSADEKNGEKSDGKKDEKSDEKKDGKKDEKSDEKKDGKKDEKSDEKKDGKKDEKSDEKKDGKKDEKSDEEKKKEAEKPKVPDTPMQQALFAINCKKYQDSVTLLKKIIVKEEKNAQAHYLLAVSYVGLRQYSEAKEQYSIVLKLAPTGKLNELATQGLKRVSSAP